MPVNVVPQPKLSLDWRFISYCESKCRFCNLIDNNTRNEEIKNILSIEDSIKIIDDFENLIKKWEVGGIIKFLGGDFMKSQYFLEIIEYTLAKDIEVELMGCARNLIHLSEHLRNVNIKNIYFSMYGLREKHDFFKCRDDFTITLDLYREYSATNIRTKIIFIMNTKLCTQPRELDELLKFIVDKKVFDFRFQRFPYIYNYKDSELEFNSHNFYSMLFNIFEIYMRLPQLYRFHIHPEEFIEKEPLWNLFFQTLGMNYGDPEQTGLLCSGCQIGKNIIFVRADGLVSPCEYLPLWIGKVPRQSLKSILINSKEINQITDINNYNKCSSCDLFKICRGCRGIAYQRLYDYLGDDPYCWKNDRVIFNK